MHNWWADPSKGAAENGGGGVCVSQLPRYDTNQDVMAGRDD